MSHRKTLTQLGWFKVAFFAPLAVGAIVVGFIDWNDHYFSGSACLTSGCINEAVIRFKVPITIMALIFPAVALVASWHRSVQTAAQIERTDKQIAATEAKNAFENCIKHREIIFKQFSELKKDISESCKSDDDWYSMLFKKNDYENFSFYMDIEDFKKEFFAFRSKKSPSAKNDRMIRLLTVRMLQGVKRQDQNDHHLIDVYKELIDGFAYICLSTDDKNEIFNTYMDDIKYWE